MPQVVRKLQKKLWIDKEVAAGEGWLEQGSVCADALKNFVTLENKLSVFSVESNDHLLKVISAIVASPKASYVCDTDYVIFDHAIIEHLEIESEVTPGDTLDEEVNKLHVDLARLSGNSLVRFAEALQDTGTLGRIPKKVLARALKEKIDAGILDKSKLSQDFLSSVHKYSNK